MKPVKAYCLLRDGKLLVGTTGEYRYITVTHGKGIPVVVVEEMLFEKMREELREIKDLVSSSKKYDLINKLLSETEVDNV